MSHPRYDWWGYIKAVIRRYPMLSRTYDGRELKVRGRRGRAPIATDYARTISRLTPVSAREYYATKCAIDSTLATCTDASDRIKLVDMVFWRRTHTLPGATLALHLGESKGRIMHAEFIRLVATYYGLHEP